jgi:hypothetical protein
MLQVGSMRKTNRREMRLDNDSRTHSMPQEPVECKMTNLYSMPFGIAVPLIRSQAEFLLPNCLIISEILR